LTKDESKLSELKQVMRNSLHNYIELSIEYAEANLKNDAANVLALIAGENRPMLHYYMAYCSDSGVELKVAAKCGKDYAFPNRLQDIPVLMYAIENNKKDAFARYALGNLYYDKGVWFKAIRLWKAALEIEPNNSAILRNLSLATYNKLFDKEEALKLMERAARYAPDDARIYYELDLLRKLTNVPIKKRLKDMIDHLALVESRDDLFTEYITLINCEKYFDFALKAIKRHSFHPWEGGEGKISAQYRQARMGAAH
jgi:tetratricopeptide (TPR) repeat protein